MATRSKIEPSEANLALVGGAQEADFSRHEVLKALVVGRDRVQDSNALAAIEEREKLFTEAGAIEPPYDPESLCLLLEHSNSLRQNVDAYVTNIDGFGHRLEPAIDFEAEDVDEQIANAIYLERVAMRDRGEVAADAPVEPKPDEVASRKKELMHLARVERSRLDSFFDFCCSDHSFVTLRRRTRQDLEVLGNGFWEVLRNRGGQISRLVHVPAYTVRLLSLDEDPVEVEERVRISPVSYDTVSMRRRFRRFVQVQGNGRQVYFKEFGDPRAVSKISGRVFSSVEELRSAAGNTDGPATEMIHFAVHSPRSAYGVPRWIGTLLSVLGSRQMEEVNYLYFENKSVPPLALLVSGGRLSKSSIPRIEDFIENNIKGKRNFHKILILEAETTPNQNVQHSGKAQIKIEPLTQAQTQEELFGKYDERNMDKVGGSFRLPRLLRGESKDFNRACYSEDTETLTEHGWKRYHEVADGERIATFNPETGGIEFHVPAARFEYHHRGEMIHIANKNCDILVTPEHKMWLVPYRSGEWDAWRLVRADEIRWKQVVFRSAAEYWEGQEEKEFVLPHIEQQTWKRPPRPPIPFDLWLEFLGYFISDGCLLQSSNAPHDYRVILSQKRPDVREKMGECVRRLNQLGWKFCSRKVFTGVTRWQVADKSLWTWLRDNVGGYQAERRIPHQYLSLSWRQLLVLYNALMAGDGNVDLRPRRNVRRYYTASPVLAGQVQELLIKIGVRASVRPASGCLAVLHIPDRTTHIVSTESDVRRVPYDGMVYCFEVSNHLFVTRRNGKVAIQGNTAQAALRFAEEQVFDPERNEFDFTVNRKLFSDMSIRFWRFKSNSPVTRDPERMTEMVERLVKANVLTPEEGRLLAGDVFNRDFRVIKAPWVKQPVPLTLAGFAPDGSESEESVKADLTTGDLADAGGLVPAQGGPAFDATFGTRPDMSEEERRRWLIEEARRLLRIRDELTAEEARIAAEKLRLARERNDRDIETIRVPAEEFKSWFEPGDVEPMEEPADE